MYGIAGLAQLRSYELNPGTNSVPKLEAENGTYKYA